MPTEKPRFTITVSDELNSAIEDYQHRARTKNKTQAVVELMEIGMERISKEINNKKSPAPEGTEEREQGIDAVENELRSLLLALGLVPDNLTAEQVEFLAHIVALIQAYFKK